MATLDTAHFDDVIIGAGMAGLSAGALLAKRGRRVLVIEAHDQPGGYAHSFRMRDFRFCAQVHYVFSCGEGETIHRLLSALGLAEAVPFVRLDPEGFDHIVVAGKRTRVPNGLPKYRDRLIAAHPEAKAPLRAYFAMVITLADELTQLDAMPEGLSLSALASAYRCRNLLRHLRWTLQDLYDKVGMPLHLQAVLAGQCGDYLLPPRDVSLLLHVALVASYDRGAFYPKHHYGHFVESIADAIRGRPGCELRLGDAVARIHTEGERVAAVTTASGRRFTGARFISNADPRLTQRLLDHSPSREDRLRQDYAYSAGTFTLYLGLRDLDLRAHGFGSFNVWHYPHADLNRVYDDQLVRHDLDDPWLFLSTPTLHSDAPGVCPPGHHLLEIATSCDYTRWARLRTGDRRAYNAEKKRVRERILDIVEARYLPKLRDHLVLRVAGTPVTNERFCRAPEGNSYGAALTPANVGIGRGPYRASLENLWHANATAGFPSVAGAIGAGMKLADALA